MTVTALDSRRPVLGGSTIAAAAGIDPWCSRVELFMRLKGRIDPVEETEPMKWGTRLQSWIFVALRVDHEIAAKEAEGLVLADPALPWLEGHPDGFAEDAVIEAKVTGSQHEHLPIPWQAQGQIYAHLSGAERILFAVLERGTHLSLRWENHNKRYVDALLRLGEEFVDYFQRDEIPPPGGSKSDREALGAAYPAYEPAPAVALDTRALSALRKLREWREVESAAHERRTELENVIKAAMGDAELALDEKGNVVATWKASVSHRTDTRALKAAHPKIAARFTTSTHLRTFRLT